MDPKFLVVEIESKDQALEMVQIMLEKGYARLMLLDDLSKHPTLRHQQQQQQSTSSSSVVSETQTQTVSSASSPLETSKSLGEAFLGDISADSDLPSTSALKEAKKEFPDLYDEILEAPFDWIGQLTSNQPEVIPVDVESSTEEPPKKRPTRSEGEHHECTMCQVRVKAPRGGRWNLQMHVIACHSSSKMYKCLKCDYEDYRKTTMRKHCFSVHKEDFPPLNITNDTKKMEWDETMSKCFPAFAHRTGFLPDPLKAPRYDYRMGGYY